MTRWPLLLGLVCLPAMAHGADGDDAALGKLLKEKGVTVTETKGVVTGVAVRDGTKVTDADFGQIGKLVQLKTLDLNSCLTNERLTQLADLAELEYLQTNLAQVTDDGLKPMAKLKSLRNVKFFHPGPAFTGAGLAHLAELPHLQSLTVAGSLAFNDEGMAAVARLTKLQEFRSWHAGATQEGVKKLTALPNLKNLNLGQRLTYKPPACPTDETIAILAEMKALEVLQLSESRLSFAALQQLKQLPALKKLTLDGVELPKADAERLQKELPKVAIEWTEPNDTYKKRIRALFGTEQLRTDLLQGDKMTPNLSRREFLQISGSVLGSLACADSFAAAADAPSGCQLRDGDVVALCGDSITSAGHYPSFLEAYQLLCGPRMNVTFVNCGRWGENSRDFPKTWDKDFTLAKPTVLTICYGMNIGRGGGVLKEPTLAEEAKALKAIVEKFKAGGGRTVVLGSPGCVDTTFHPNSDGANASLAQLRDNARKVAKETDAIFADVHTPMIEVMAKAKAKHGKDYAFAGGKGDGLHPGQAGHLVMAWAFLKALGYDGQVGTLTVALDKNEASASAGHKVLGCQGGVVDVESARCPFCFLADTRQPKDLASANSTRSVVELFPFNADVNRLTLVVRGATAKNLKITWGGQARKFEAETAAKGINLAAEFLDNPFAGPFGNVMAALSERNSCRKWLTQDAYKNDASIPKRLDAALQALVPVPVKHAIKVEPVS